MQFHCMAINLTYFFLLNSAVVGGLLSESGSGDSINLSAGVPLVYEMITVI
mgnify:CR=1